MLTVTTSIGGALIHGSSEGDTVQSILERADKELYAAKNSGRNCTVFENTGKLDPNKFIQTERPSIE